MAVSITGIDLADLYKRFTEQAGQARTAQAGREQTATGALQQALGLYGPQYLQGQEKTALAAAGQSAVGRGLAGTTVPMAASAGIKAGFQDLRTQGRERGLANLAQFAGSYQDPTMVTPSALSHLATGGFSGLLDVAKTALATSGGGGGGGTYGQYQPLPTLSSGLPTYGPFASLGSGGGGSASALPTLGGGGGGYGSSYGGGGYNQRAPSLAPAQTSGVAPLTFAPFTEAEMAEARANLAKMNQMDQVVSPEQMRAGKSGITPHRTNTQGTARTMAEVPEGAQVVGRSTYGELIWIKYS